MAKSLRQLTCLSLISISSLAQANFLPAAFQDPVDKRFDMGGYLAENAYGFLPVPIMITEPAFGYGGGFFGLFLHESDENKKRREELAMKSIDGGAELVTPAVTLVGGAATENGTWVAAVAHRHTWLDERIRYFIGAGYADLNIDIYINKHLDIGDHSFSFNKGMQTNTTGYGWKQRLEFKVADTPLYLGVAQIWGKIEVGSDNQLLDFILKNRLGEQSTSSGAGITFNYDTTNNYFFPTQGTSIAGRYMWYSDAIGSDYEYEKFILDAQTYFPIAKDWSLGLAAGYKSLTTDQANLPPLSNPYISLRGISRYRYQDNYVSTLQTQVSWDLDTRWTLLGFVGIGSAADEFGDLYQDVEAAYGAGFRYKIARRYGMRLGMDFAFSDDDNAFYFNLGSGF